MPSSKPTRWPDGKTPQTAAELRQCLDIIGVMTEEESASFVRRLPPNADIGDAKGLANELVRAKKLTKLQSSGLLQGKLKYLLFGEYLILEKIGQGGMGQVLKAEHRRMKRTVALKILATKAMSDPDAVRRFQREVQAAARLIHPNIVTAFDANESDGVHFLVMEYVAGMDLSSIVNGQGPLPVQKAIDYALQAARGLAYAHAKGIIHRDIKPANLLLDQEGTIKILDMGLARLNMGEPEGQELTQSGQVMGTVDYMAPEQALDTKTADARADIYSLGCTLYRLVTGQSMYEGDTFVKKILAHREAPVPSLVGQASRLPSSASDLEALDPVFRRMVAKQAQDRYQTMAEVVEALEGLQRGIEPRSPSSAHLHSSSKHGEEDSKLTEFLAGLNSAKKAAAPASATATQAVKPETTSVEETINRVSATESTTANLGKTSVAKAAPPASAPAKQAVRRPPFAVICGSIAAVALSLCGIGAVILFTFGRNGQAVKEKTPESTLKMAVGSAAGSGKASGGSASAAPQLPVPATDATGGFALQFDQRTKATIPTLVLNLSEPLTIEAYFAQTGVVDLPEGNWASTIFAMNRVGLTSGSGWGMKLIGREDSQLDHFLEHRAVIAGKPTHVAGVSTGSQMRLFVDGVLVQSKDISDNPPANVQTSLEMGYAFLGTLDEVRISTVARYDRKFTPQARFEPDANTLALYHCDEGQGDSLTDASAYKHHGQIVGGNWVRGIAGGVAASEVPKQTNLRDFALSFNGQDNYVEIPTLTSVNPSIVTAEGWFWPQQPTGWGAVSVFGPNCLGIWSASASEMGFTSFNGPSDVTNRLVVVNWSAARSVHVAFVREPTDARIYIDGKRQPIKRTAYATQNQGTGPARLGTGGPPKRIEGYFTGQMDELRFSSIARYTADFVPAHRFEPDEHTIALYHFDDATGNVLADSSTNQHHGKVIGAKWVPAFGSPTESPANVSWTSLFNGKDLSGWKRQPGDTGNWRAEDGVLKGQVASTSYLFSERGDWANFHLRAEARVNSGGSAGITCRAPFGLAGPVGFPSCVLGYLAKINANSNSDPRKTGGLYVMRKDSISDGVTIDAAAIGPNEWFTLDAIVEDNRVIIKVNGQTTTDFLDDLRQFTGGHIALQAFSSGTQVEFRKIEVQELGPRRASN